MIDGFLSVSQASAVTGYSVSGIHNLLRADKIEGARKLGKEWAIPFEWAVAHQHAETVAQQARAAGVSRQTIYNRKKRGR